MDPLTHYLSAKLTRRIFIKSDNRRVISLFFLSAVFPDIDYVTRFYGAATYLKYHRGITHSFVGITVLSLFLSYLFYLKEKSGYLRLFLLSFVSMLIHILFDWTNSYGTQLWLPFSSKRAALDSVFIIDIYILIAMAISLFIILMVKKASGKNRLSLIFSSVILFYILSKIVFNFAVVSEIKKLDIAGADKVSVAAFPDVLVPIRFKCVIETKDKYYTFNHSVFDGSEAEMLERMTEHEIVNDNKYIDRAKESYVGKIFLDFSRYPYYMVRKQEGHTLVEIANLSFRYSKNSKPHFLASILISDDMRIIKESFDF